MIIKCPECETSFLVPAESLAPKGRKVRCSNCHTQWFQKYNPDDGAEGKAEETALPEDDPKDALENTEEDAQSSVSEDEDWENQNPEDSPEGEEDDIPASVRPDASIEDDLDIAPEQEIPQKTRRGVSYALAAGAVILILIVFGLSGEFVSRYWPSSTVFYNSLGYDYTILGEDLVFDSVEARVVPLKAEKGQYAKGRKLVIDGQIINVVKPSRDLAPVKIEILGDNSDVLETFTFKPVGQADNKQVEGEAVLKFQQEFEDEISPKANSLRIEFAPKQLNKFR